MSTIKYPITLDLKRDYHQVLVMKEGDVNSREIIITVTDNGNPFDLTDRFVKFKWHKPDHHFIFEDCVILENKIIITCTEQMLITGGLAKCEIILYDDSSKENASVLSTMEFDVSIRDSVISNTDIESSDEFGALNNLILSNKDLNESLQQLEADVKEAENTRNDNEKTREDNEKTRNNNEHDRISAESQRQTDTANAINSADIAGKNATNAANAAVNATKDANNTTKEANRIIEEMKTLIKSDNLIHTDDLGIAGGVATLDENGNIPASQLPSYVDDVLEGHAAGASLNSAGNAMCASGFILKDETEECLPETGKIYVDIDTNLQYRWTGSTYISTGSVLELGTTSSTAFPGNRGLSLENRVTDIEEYHHNIPAGDIKFDNTEASLLSANVQDALNELSKEATSVSKGLLSAEDKKRIDNYANVQIISAILPASGWLGASAPFTQTIAVPDLSVYNNCSIELPETASADEENAAAEADISSITYDETVGMTFTANGAKPEIDIPIQLSVGTSINVVEIPKYLGETPVTGVKGAAETAYRTGDVDIDLKNIASRSTGDAFYYKGNVDDLLYDAQGAYWVEVKRSTGTHPVDNGYYQLEVIASNSAVVMQIAHCFDDCATYYRMYTNNKWYAWSQGIDEASTSKAGLMSEADKEKLDELWDKNESGQSGTTVNVLTNELGDWKAGQISNTIPESNVMNDVIYANGKFVAVGKFDGNQIIYSADGISWDYGYIEDDSILKAITYGDDGKFVAVGTTRTGGNGIFTCSTDGINFEPASTIMAAPANDIAYGNGKYVTVFSSGGIPYSSDGITWLQGNVSAIQGRPLDKVVFGNGVFVAISISTSAVFYSTTGTSWSACSISLSNNPYSLCYAEGKFILAVYGGKTFYSTDGTTWYQGNSSALDIRVPRIAYGNNTFIMLPGDASLTQRYFYSKDGINWTRINITESIYANSLCYGKQKFVAVREANSGLYYNEFLKVPKTVEDAINELYEKNNATATYENETIQTTDDTNLPTGGLLEEEYEIEDVDDEELEEETDFKGISSGNATIQPVIEKTETI